MIKGVRIRLLPTTEQEVLMFKSIGISRFAYNWGLDKWNKLYEIGEKPNGKSLKKLFNNSIKRDSDFKWLKEVSAQVTSQAFLDLNTAYLNYFRGLAEKPKFKSKKKSRKSFFIRYDSIKFKDGNVNLEKIGKIKYKTNYEIPDLPKYNNPRCNFDGKYWYLSLGFEQNEKQVELNKNLSIGIDLGIKDLAIISAIDEPIKNINKTRVVKLLTKKLKRLQKQVSRKYEKNKLDNKFIKTKNIIKLERKIKLIYRRLKNIRNNHVHQATNTIIKMKPYRIVMEDLNISGIMKNRYLSKAIQEQCLYEFIRQMRYKCKFNGIEFIQADRFYASSKICSSCGEMKKDLKLKDRIYKCNSCGNSIDRDKNASYNLASYTILA